MAARGEITDGGVSAIDARVLAENYDAGSISRGEAYAADGRVRLIGSEPHSISAVVAGSGRNTYVVRVTWRELATGIVVDDHCSCPLGGFCKHAVATILTAQHEAAEAILDMAEHGPSWRQVLGGFDVDVDDPESAPSPLALQFGVNTPRVSRYAPTPAPHLTVRPMRKGRRDQWIKTGASWRDLHYVRDSSDLDPAQVAALRGIWNASPRHSYYPDTGPISLEPFGPELWLHLRNAVASGVELISATGAPVILHDDTAAVDVDLVAGDDGTATLTTSLVAAGGRLDEGDDPIGFVGTRPHGLFVRRADGAVELFRLEHPLDPAMSRMLAGPPLRVPAGDVDELLEVYQPVLARQARLGSSDGSVTITTRHFDGLTLWVMRHEIDLVAVSWGVRYTRGTTTTRYGFHDPGGRLRDHRAETRSAHELTIPPTIADLLVDAGGTPRNSTLRGLDTVRLLTEAVPWLAEHTDVEVLVETVADATLPELREATADPLVELHVSDAGVPSDQNDWFDLGVTVSVDGEQVPFVALFTALSRNEPIVVLTSGTWLRIDRPEFERLHALIEEARGLVDEGEDDDTIRINRFQISWFDELAELGVVKSQSDRWAANVARMNRLSAPESGAVPPSLKAELRPYQREGLGWLQFLESNELGGILADDMGLGKTVQILALCASVLETRPDARFLVVAPTSVVENWQREAARFVPTMPVVAITGTAKRRGTPLAEAIADASLVVTSYTLFRLEFDEYALQPWDLLLLDEAQYVKNHQGKTYKAVRQLPARSKIAITGTPLENSLMDLWSLLSITAPGLYPDPSRFSHAYRKPIEKGDAPELLATLRRRITPLMRRRTKAAVLTELPPKIEQVVEVELHPKHRRLYQTRLQRERAKVLGLVDDMQSNRFVIFKSLTLLRQLALDPGLVDEADDHIGSAKLDRLVEDVTQIVAEGHRALVFSQFTRYLRRAEQRLGAAGIDTVYLDGRTRKRAEVIDRFKSGGAPVFLISLKAGGVGLNLAEADYCFILDPWWNPAAETQAVDRAHRIGQVNPVVVYRYVSAGTIEEKVMELKARKAALFSDVVDADGALSGALTAEDIRGLFDAG